MFDQTAFPSNASQCVWRVGLTIANELAGMLLLRWKSSRGGKASVELAVLKC